jgi:hypothetical protein
MKTKILALVVLVVTLFTNTVFANSKKTSVRNEPAVAVSAKVLGESNNYVVVLLEFVHTGEGITDVDIKDMDGETLASFEHSLKSFTKLIKINPEELSKFQVVVTNNGTSVRKDFEVKIKSTQTITIEGEAVAAK